MAVSNPREDTASQLASTLGQLGQLASILSFIRLYTNRALAEATYVSMTQYPLRRVSQVHQESQHNSPKPAQVGGRAPMPSPPPLTHHAQPS